MYLVATLLAFAESAGLGMFLPGEVAISGIASGLPGVPQAVVLVVFVTAGAVLGDHLGYVVGRRGGTRLGSSRLVRRLGVDKWDRATALVKRRGMLAVLVSRMLPVVRSVTPAVAGVSGLTYRRFALASVVGSACWATLWVGAGVLLEGAGLLDNPVYVVVAVVVTLLVAMVWRIRRGQRPARAAAGDPGVGNQRHTTVACPSVHAELHTQ